jgi:sulfate permease, SulP family
MPEPGTHLPLFALTGTLRNYRPQWLGKDISAGLAIAAVGLPSAIAYPAIAGLPPETGLYASILAVTGYALFGPSQRLIMGPDAATMIMLGAVLSAIPLDQGPQRVMTASALALLVGALCLLARLLRFDLIANFLSRPILTGFMTGISLSILVGQIGRFTGLKIEADGLVLPVLELMTKLSQVNWPSVALAGAMLGLLMAMKRFKAAVPGPVVVVALSVLMSWLFGFAGFGIRVVGDIPGQLPALTLPWTVTFPLRELIVGALAVWLVSFSAGIVSARAFGAQGNYRVDASQELRGFAAANIASGLFGGFPVTSSDSRTAINLSVGGKTQLAGLASAAVLIIILIFLGPLLKFLPTPALGAILAAASIGLMDFGGLKELWRVSRVEFVFAIIGVFAPILLGVLNGVMVAVGATLAYLIYRDMWPPIAMLGRIGNQPGFYKLHRVMEAAPVPGLAVCLVQGSVLFFSADHVKDEIEAIAENLPEGTRWLVLDASSSPHMDTTAATALVELARDLQKHGIKFGIADLHSESLKLLTRAGVLDAIGKDMVFTGLEDMLAAFKQRAPVLN